MTESNVAAYNYDSLGRLTNVIFPSGAMATFSFDNAGNRTSRVEVPSGATPPPITVTSLPKKQCGDFGSKSMIVLLSSGSLIGWGDNTTGVLANGNVGATAAPPQQLLFDPNTTVPPFNATIVDWSFVNANIYIVYSNGWVYSAGQNPYGQLGHGDTTARPQLSRIEYFVTNDISVTKVWAAGSAFTTNGSGCVYFQDSNYVMYACGQNAYGNLGNAATPTTNVTTPAPCAGILTSPYVTDVAVSNCDSGYSCYMLTSSGGLMVAGYNAQGQLGTGTTSNVTGAFISATMVGGSDVSDFVSISANGGYTTIPAANALAIDSSGNVWTVGYNGHGELGIGSTTNQTRFTQVTALTNIVEAKLGGGFVGYGYALGSTGTLYTWGYNGGNNLFLNDTTTPVSTPVAPADLPGAVSKVFLPRENNLSTDSQLIVLTTSGRLAYAGASNGQEAIANTQYPGAYSYIASPLSFLNGTETVADLFVHGTATTQRWFVLSSAGNLYACGSNVDAICTGGVSSGTPAANVEWYQISF
jgi:alpha-tubulin suppressor-like RCC1 family protein